LRAVIARGGRFFPLLGLALLAGLVTFANTGCLGNPDDEQQVESSEHALARGGGSAGQSYTCDANGSCMCDKSIENDCEDMSGICKDSDITNLINCINGWLTTHCTCTKALVAPPKPKFPIKSVAVSTKLLQSR
jgi:hypothetical protein